MRRHAGGGVGGQALADGLARLADARQVRRRRAALGHDLRHRLQRAVLRGAAGAEGDRAELGLQRIQLLARSAQLVGAFGRLGGKKFEADRMVFMDALLRVACSA
jgi:hypothetical protein